MHDPYCAEEIVSSLSSFHRDLCRSPEILEILLENTTRNIKNIVQKKLSPLYPPSKAICADPQKYVSKILGDDHLKMAQRILICEICKKIYIKASVCSEAEFSKSTREKNSKNEVGTLLVLSGHKRFPLNSWEKDKRHWLVSV